MFLQEREFRPAVLIQYDGRFPTCPKNCFAHCVLKDYWIVVIIIIIANIQVTMGVMYPFMVSILDFVLD